ncbi:hypothetical protein ACFL6Y_03790 [Elusimicrobiota bacterium]
MRLIGFAVLILLAGVDLDAQVCLGTPQDLLAVQNEMLASSPESLVFPIKIEPLEFTQGVTGIFTKNWGSLISNLLGKTGLSIVILKEGEFNDLFAKYAVSAHESCSVYIPNSAFDQTTEQMEGIIPVKRNTLYIKSLCYMREPEYVMLHATAHAIDHLIPGFNSKNIDSSAAKRDPGQTIPRFFRGFKCRAIPDLPFTSDFAFYSRVANTDVNLLYQRLLKDQIGERFVTGHAKTNPEEFLAEGMASFSKGLRRINPSFFKIISDFKETGCLPYEPEGRVWANP